MMRRRWALARALAMAALGGSPLTAQTLAGRVLDASDSGAVSGAEVQVTGMRSVRADGRGAFRFGDVAAGTHRITVRMLGYAPLTDTVTIAAGQTIERTLRLARVPQLLKQMVVKGRSLRVPAGYEDIYRRANTTNGTFVTHEQIDSINPRDVAGLLNFTSPVRSSPNRDAPDRLRSIRCQSFVPGTNVSGRAVTLFLNGTPLNDTTAINEVLDHMHPAMIQAVEVYNGPTSVPAMYQPACAVIAIWTRRGQ